MPKHSKRNRSVEKTIFVDSSSDDDAIHKKMRKLQKKLKKLDERDRLLASTSSMIPAEPATDHDIPRYRDSDYFPSNMFEYKRGIQAGSTLPSRLLSEERGSPSGSQTLDPTILALLGAECPPTPKEKLAPPLHKNLAAAWARFVKNGLSDEERNKIMAKYPPPENCVTLGTPKLNPEVQDILPESLVRREGRLMDHQKQVGAALSALGQLITYNLSQEGGGNLYCLELASEASKLLLDFQYKQSVTRRSLLNLNFHQELKDALEENRTDEYLYGNRLGERAIKELQVYMASSKKGKRPINKFKSPHWGNNKNLSWKKDNYMNNI